jgi:hypothetical protein
VDFGGLLRGIHFGSYWMKSNDVVHLMAHDLADLCDLDIVDTGIYDSGTSDWFDEERCFSAENPIRWLRHEAVMKRVAEHAPDFVVVNSGGMSLRPETIDELRAMQIVVIGMSLSDPDVFPIHGAHYASLYDLFYTNSEWALHNQYPHGDSETRFAVLPFAASSRLHHPYPEVERRFDVVVVGHARRDRMELVSLLSQHVRVGLFGKGWGDDSSVVNGAEHARALNSGRLCLSFAETVAGHTNVKVGVFEAIACGAAVVTRRFPEIENYFTFGFEILGFEKDSELLDLVRFHAAHPHVTDWIAENGRRRLLEEHTWSKRWLSVLAAVESLRSGAELPAMGRES